MLRDLMLPHRRRRDRGHLPFVEADLFHTDFHLNSGGHTIFRPSSKLLGKILGKRGRWGVPEYRAYLVGPDHKYTDAKVFDCADDGAATAEALKLVDDCDVELWQGTRMIGTLKKKKASL